MKRSFLTLSVLIAVATISLSYALPDEQPLVADSVDSNLPFLEVGEYYVIRFPATHHPFRKISHQMTRTSTGRPANWTITYETSMFRVRRHGRAGWMLLDHPKDIKQSAKFGMAVMRHTHASTADRSVSRKAIDEFETVSTWINLDHAIAITGPPNPNELKIDVDVTVKRKDH